MKLLHSLKDIRTIVNKADVVCLVTSKRISRMLHWAIKDLGVSRRNIILIPDGEAAKEWSQVERLLKKFMTHHLSRTSIILVLGGGSLGDSVGFAASMYLRGIGYIQIPTTLLSQVDSAHGGKTGINFLGNKNQIGSFYPPLAVVMDSRFIRSLPREQLVDGLGEIIKAGFIKDPSILKDLQTARLATLAKSPVLKKIIKKTIAVKYHYINKDPRDTRARLFLNAGHTIGHALELKYRIGHGRAVLIGLLKELALTESMGLTSPSVRKNLLTLLNRLGIDEAKHMRPDAHAIFHDKKRTGDSILFPVIEKEGKARLVPIKMQKLKRLTAR